MVTSSGVAMVLMDYFRLAFGRLVLASLYAGPLLAYHVDDDRNTCSVLFCFSDVILLSQYSWFCLLAGTAPYYFFL